MASMKQVNMIRILTRDWTETGLEPKQVAKHTDKRTQVQGKVL